MRNGRGEADLRAQRRDHEGPSVEHGAGAKRQRHCRWADDDAARVCPVRGREICDTTLQTQRATTQPPHDHATAQIAADSTAAGPEPTAPRGRLSDFTGGVMG